MNAHTAAPPSAAPLELSVVIPCLNEAETLETCIRKAQRSMEENGIVGEVVVGDNGSTDGSQEIATRCGARVVNVPVRGYGAALYFATEASRGRYIIMGDADDSYDFSNLMPFVSKLREGYDLVMGNRFAGGIKPGAMPWKNRYIGNPILSGIGQLLFKARVRDFHCGLRGFSRQAFEDMALSTRGMEYASEMVIKATLKNMKIAEVPTTLSPDGRSRPPHLSPWRDGWRHLRFMMLFSPKWLFLYPGLLLVVVGLVLEVWLAPGPRRVGSVVLDIHTLLYAAFAVLVGFQGISIYLFSRVFAARQGLLPESKSAARYIRTINLELGLLIGLGITLVGAAGLLAGFLSWANLGFGPLDPAHMMRLTIPSGLAVTLGLNMMFTSFFLATLTLPTKMDQHV